MIVISSFSNQTSYENQTKKAITNKGIQEAMVEMLRHNLEIYFIENPLDAEKIAGQVLVNKRSREDAEKTRLNLKGQAHRQNGHHRPGGKVCGLPQQGCGERSSLSWRATPPWARSSRPGTPTTRR